MWVKLRGVTDFVEKCRRTLLLMRKPSWKEFSRTVRMCTIGTGLVGLIGFAIYLLAMTLLG
jgi:protein translocase SEC61 complex gamma subunit